ncbi:DUF956 family protein [Secundilactobacillus paracollinoides]|uniref:DUF956 family protein n=1 Tax=Secundilactobacillus paracollinoides TaxID=240427 RepID=UPI0012EA3D77|nr:DUF956 family protein [Secundilactobacillus paracollinoides]
MNQLETSNALIQTKANFFKTGFHAYHGELMLTDQGLIFDAQAMGKVTIPYSQMRVVWVQVVLRRIYRGIVIEAPDGRRFHFVTSHTKKLLHVLNKQVPVGTVRHWRKSVKQGG